MNTQISENTLAQAIVDTIREPLLVLDKDLRIIAASRSYCQYFTVSADEINGYLLSEVNGGRWNIASLLAALNLVLPGRELIEAIEIDQDFENTGRRVMVLNARKVVRDDPAFHAILLAIEDVTERVLIERERMVLLREKDLLLEEMQHRVANSLQIIASILLIKARTVTSEETRGHLHDAHERVLAVAAVQKHLQITIGAETVDLRSYLEQLCKGLGGSMIGESRSIAVHVCVDEGRATSSEAVSMGLIVTELMINALKHAFPIVKPGNAIWVRYESNATGWRLTLTDNGIGKLDENSLEAKIGLGTSLIAALADQLGARVETISNSSGTSVSITRATFAIAPATAV